MQVDTESSVSIERSAGSKVRGDRIRVLDDAIAYQMNILYCFLLFNSCSMYAGSKDTTLCSLGIIPTLPLSVC